MGDGQQLSLFKISTVRKRKSKFVNMYKQYAGKAKLKLNPQREEKQLKGRQGLGIYGNKPLFYGLPTMKRWLEWVKNGGKT